MAYPLIDMAGERYGRLVVTSLSVEKTNQGKPLWVCKCDCGNTILVPRRRLINGNTKSCGCYRKELSREQHTTHGYSRADKGHSRLYRIWSGMKDRCLNPKSKYWDRYGGAGKGVCDEWASDYMAFHEWAMANGYSEDLTLDRIDNSKGYSPENCRWTTYSVQENNRTNNVLYEVDGQTYTLAQLARREGLTRRMTENKYKETNNGN